MHSEPNQSFTNRERKETTQRLRRETKKRRKNLTSHTHWDSSKIEKRKKRRLLPNQQWQLGLFLSERKLCITKMSYTSSIRVSTIVALILVLINVSIMFTYQQLLRHIISGEKFTLLTNLNLSKLFRTTLIFSEPLQTSLNFYELL